MSPNLIASQSTAVMTGATLAMLAAGLALSAPATAAGGKDKAMAKPAAEVALVHCSGVNQCKGHNDCGTASNACTGMGSCKGQGYVGASASACADVGGKVINKGKSTKVAASSQIKCFGINQCKGHNDCGSSANACKGMGSCKGKGFVLLPAASCGNIGGSTSAT